MKEYFYLLMFTGLQSYVTESYISWATGNLSRTMSGYFKGISGRGYALCIDVFVDSTFENDAYGDGKRPFGA
jgi:hypothetical protein